MWIVCTAKREKWKGSKGESDGLRQLSKLRHEKNCCSQENSSLTSASHSNNGGLWFLTHKTSSTATNTKKPWHHPQTCAAITPVVLWVWPLLRFLVWKQVSGLLQGLKFSSSAGPASMSPNLHAYQIQKVEKHLMLKSLQILLLVFLTKEKQVKSHTESISALNGKKQHQSTHALKSKIGKDSLERFTFTFCWIKHLCHRLQEDVPTHTSNCQRWLTCRDRVGRSLLPPHPEFMSNTTKLAIRLQHTAGTSNRPLYTPKIERLVLMGKLLGNELQFKPWLF